MKQQRLLTQFKKRNGIKIHFWRIVILVVYLISTSSCRKDVGRLEKAGYDMTTDLLVHQVKKADWDAVETAETLGETARSILVPFTRDKDPEIRQIALACLDNVGGPDASEAALKLLLDEDSEVVSSAIELLHNHPPFGQAEQLLKCYQQTDDPYAQEQIPVIAGRLAPEIDMSPWVPLLDLSADEEELNVGLLAGLARMGHEPARKRFVSMMLSSRGKESASLIEYCSYMQDTWIVPHMIPLLDRRERAVTLFPDRDIYMRTCDLALEAIVELTKAEVSFPVNRPEQYNASELESVKRIASSVKPR